jgi:thymidylate kinase
VRTGYLQLARRWPERIQVIDSMHAEAVVEAAIWNVVLEKMKP